MNNSPPALEAKRKAFERLMHAGARIEVDLIPDGSMGLPAPNAAAPRLRLDFNATGRAACGKDGIYETLLFYGAPHLICVPWPAIFFVADAKTRAAYYVDDNVIKGFTQPMQSPASTKPPPRFTVIAGGGQASNTEPTPRPALRLVKQVP